MSGLLRLLKISIHGTYHQNLTRWCASFFAWKIQSEIFALGLVAPLCATLSYMLEDTAIKIIDRNSARKVTSRPSRRSRKLEWIREAKWVISRDQLESPHPSPNNTQSKKIHSNCKLSSIPNSHIYWAICYIQADSNSLCSNARNRKSTGNIWNFNVEIKSVGFF